MKHKRIELNEVVPAGQFKTRGDEAKFLKTLQAYFPANFHLPIDNDIEEVIIGTIVQFSGSIALAIPIITENDFHNPRIAKIYKVCRKMYSEGEGIDLLTVSNTYRKYYGEHIGAELSGYSNRVVSDAHIVTHCKAL